jgi:phytol kinase
MINPWLGIGLVMGTLVVLLAALGLVQRLLAPHPEIVRKLLHVAMGLVTLTFPWLFDTAWPILLLCGLAVALMLALRWVSELKSRFGNVLGGVSRFSLGEVYFPVAVAVLFLLFLHEDPVAPERRLILYCIPILLLTLADTAAALIGVGYGRHRYSTADGLKSTEGSLAFFTCAFFIVHVPVLLFTDTGRLETLLSAVLLAWLATLFEAVAWGGLDNLVLPLVSFLLLKIYLGMDAADLLLRLLVTAALMTFLVVYRHWTTLSGSAVFGAFLVGYISWALGGWHWLVAPLILFVSYTLLSPRTESNTRRIHNVHAVLCVSSAGLVWLFLSRIFGNPEFLYPYTLAFAAHLAIIGIARLRFDYPRMSALWLLTACTVRGWLLLFLPYLLAEGVTPTNVRLALLALPGVAFAALAFYATQPGLHDCPTDVPRWLRQATHAGLGSVVGLVLLYST